MNTQTRETHSTNGVESLRFLSPEQVRQVREQFGTPTYVYDERSLESQARTMLDFPNAFGLTVYFSLKGNSTGAVIKIFDRLGLHFDASSIWEAKRAIAVGAEPSKILLTAQEVPPDFGDYVERGMQYNACSLGQLELYGRKFPGREVSLRVNPGQGTGFINRLTSGGPKSSFGIWHELLDDAMALVRKYDLKVARIHQHIGSGHDPEAWLRITGSMLELAKRFGPVSVINVGGGYRVKALRAEHEVDYADIGERVRGLFESYAEETGVRPRLEIEPGTFLVANCGSLVATVTDVTSTGPDGYSFLKLDAGLTEVIRPGFYGSLHPLVGVPAEGEMRAQASEYLVTGHTCIAGDMLTVEVRNPENVVPQLIAETRPGDLLVVERAGGYCASMNMKNFNSFPEAPEVLLRKDGTFTLIRKRQTLEQMIENEIVPQDLSAGAAA
ncbi:MAG TPA: diaminopimelate decarboxylase [Pyrinomonadaceae bacterium]|nr:diaminopimelate decarboxylase [Pyrinomonadaceae bacterium]